MSTGSRHRYNIRMHASGKDTVKSDMASLSYSGQSVPRQRYGHHVTGVRARMHDGGTVSTELYVCPALVAPTWTAKKQHS